eukprot:GHVQ01016483.1.p1 GENE.GHVQ01016483.1~~GHVQ01016483.1.p1  ORF type:complete len:174 (+),score=28.72 GHVQ01016483.1:386-907(+)
MTGATMSPTPVSVVVVSDTTSVCTDTRRICNATSHSTIDPLSVSLSSSSSSLSSVGKIVAAAKRSRKEESHKVLGMLVQLPKGECRLSLRKMVNGFFLSVLIQTSFCVYPFITPVVAQHNGTDMHMMTRDPLAEPEDMMNGTTVVMPMMNEGIVCVFVCVCFWRYYLCFCLCL